MYKYDDLLGTQVSAPIVPASLEDTYPTHDSTYGKGGYKEVATIEDRNNIPEERLKEGTLVYVQDTEETYKYLGNRQWREVEALGNDVDLSKFALKSDLDALATVAKTGDYNDLINKPTFNEFATKSELSNKQDKLPDGVNGQVLKWNNGWKPGTDETGTAAETEINKLRLTHEGDNIQLKYNNTTLSSVPDNNSGGGEAGDITSQITSKLDITHDSNERLHLTWNGNMIGSGTEDLKGKGDDSTPVTVGQLYFDNPIIGLPVNADRNNALCLQYSTAHIYWGPGEKTIILLECLGYKQGETVISGKPSWIQITNNKNVTINIPENTLQDIIGKSYIVNFRATYEDGETTGTREGCIQLVGLNTGTDGVSYSLSTGIAAIRKGVGLNAGQMIPSSFTPRLVKAIGSSELSTYLVNELPDGFRMKCFYDNGNLISPETDGSYKIPYVATNQVAIELYYDNLLIDAQYIPIIPDGVNGISATNYKILPQGTSLRQVQDTRHTSGKIYIQTASKVRGLNDMLFQSNETSGTGEFLGKFYNDEDNYGAKITVELDGTIDNTAVFTRPQSNFYPIEIEINKEGYYNIALVSLYDGDSRVASIIIPIIQLAESGESQNLPKSILVEHVIPNDQYNTPTIFRDGRTEVGGYLVQEFVKYANPADPENWGVYLCIDSNKNSALLPSTIPTDHNHFAKMTYTFAEFVNYLVADRAFIDSLTSKQVVIVDNSNKVVAGMTSGDAIPVLNEDGTTKLDENGKPVTQANNSTVRIWAGATSGNITAAPFRVYENGRVVAVNLEMTGSGSFNGSVTATEFKVVDSNNNNQMWMTTWEELRQENMEVSGLDSVTLNSLNSNPQTPVIGMSYGNNIYLLTPFLLREHSGDTITYREAQGFYCVEGNQLTLTSTLGETDTRKIFTSDKDSKYYDQNHNLLTSNTKYYRCLNSNGSLSENILVLGHENIYPNTIALSGQSDVKLFQRVSFNNGNREDKEEYVLRGPQFRLSPPDNNNIEVKIQDRTLNYYQISSRNAGDKALSDISSYIRNGALHTNSGGNIYSSNTNIILPSGEDSMEKLYVINSKKVSESDPIYYDTIKLTDIDEASFNGESGPSYVLGNNFYNHLKK